jgi:hypothetical protein
MSGYSGGMKRRNAIVSERVQERRRREAEAPRLAAEVPELASLNLEIMEVVSETASENSYIRRVVVAAAPALFDIPCGDPSCEGGGHDITLSIMRALRSQLTEFSGEDACHGSIRQASCGRTLRYTGTATYESK